ncbi:uncharacterized protein LOC125825105 [Solanum verrucosum]|uniref:uncharacterized protein LOC125825105 n=1 Tax=Solanum verrucosum TaxID=315347 RepID=UPI0020CFEA8A|nr:uncharacterized protein LOC125825105 [Solanum verrucosum]
MPSRGAYARNENARNANAAPPVPNQEVLNTKFRKTIQLLAQSVTYHNNQQVQVPTNTNVGLAADRVRDFIRMNLPEFLGSQVGEEPKNFIDEVKKIFGVMQVTSNERFDFASYQLKDVVDIWFTQWKENRGTDDQKGRATGSKSQGSVSGNRTYPNCPKCGKNHSGKCLARKERCFGCGQSGHRLQDLPSKQGQRGSNSRAQSTNSAARTGRSNQQGNSSGTGGG